MSSDRPDRKRGAGAPEPLRRILRVAPYQQGRFALPGHPDPIKLSSNESALGPSPAALAAYREAAAALHRYPDGSQSELRTAIAEVHGLDPAGIFCGNGSAELIGLVTRTFVGDGDELLLPESHFEMCPIYGKAQGAEIVLAPDDDFSVSVDALLAAITPRTRLIALANPSTPAGTCLPRAQIERLHAGVPPRVILLLDGAYAEYVTDGDYDPGAALVERSDNVVMTRTFSKAHGLAGLRIGWAYAPPAVAALVQRIRTPFNTNAAALAAAAAAIRDTEFVARARAENRRELAAIRSRLKALGLRVSDSVTNFYLIDFGHLEQHSAAGAAAFLEGRGILPRPVNPRQDRDVLRITVGRPADNAAVLEALAAYLRTPD